MTHRLPRCSRGELLLTLFYALSRGVCCSIRLGDVPNRGLRIRMAHDISLAMHYLHSRQIVHRGKAAVKSMHGVHVSWLALSLLHLLQISRAQMCL